MSGAGSWDSTQISHTSVILPPAGTHTEELDRLQDILKSELITVQMPLGTRQNAIVLLRLTNLFPLRYVRRVGELKQELDKRMAQGSGDQKILTAMELFTEGDGTQWPDLFPISGEESAGERLS